ncbi:cyclase [Amycolatopsis rubida]|uniref:Cyclase n=1 Tax=Amycolatopsis rubida TaxID=112413 RepID=A0ABX0BUV6_9PSEU|nr:MULTISPECIES: SRPBCC family protein [Amycolatopsis]MYW93789.1 cyclase [Amycolatopsis rubida]NEC58779.1 cyclase [Amycolatopsis rubida]OAP22978.1 Polyketide cyclase / dehydrase and lipid transport [Amycolatopsis sp. M39]
MRTVALNIVFGGARLDEAFDAVLRWELPAPETGSSWEWNGGTAEAAPVITSGVRPRWLDFRTGKLRWNEEIRSHREDGEIRFVLTDGDFAEFAGRWTFRTDGDDVAVRFEAGFDFGIPSMESLLDPIAATAVTATIARAVLGMVPRGRVEDGPEQDR